MTLKRPIINSRAMQTVLPLAGLGIVAAALSGCGGASTNTGGLGVPTLNSGPVVYGINAAAAQVGGANVQGETSGLSFTPAGGTTEGVIVGATSFHVINGAGPIPVYQTSFPNGVSSNGSVSSPGVPLGFTPSGNNFYYNSSVAAVALPTNYAGTLIFGAYISNGTFGSKLADLNPSSVVLTSSDAQSFSQPLAFNSGFGTGVLGQDAYQTAPFPIPAFMQTTGLHDLHVTVADVDGQSSTTDFTAATVAPTAVALFLQSLTVNTAATATAAATTTTNAITPGDTVTIDSGAGIGVYPAGYTPTIADAQGTVVLFTTPGTHTLTETNSKGTVQTETFTLAATTAGTTLLAPPTPDGAPAGAIRVIHPAVKRTFKTH